MDFECDIIETLNNIIDRVCDDFVSNEVTSPEDVLKRKQPVRTRTVGYVYSGELIKQCNRIERVKGRALLVDQLIRAYQLPDRLKGIDCFPATESQLRTFHSQEYLSFIKTIKQDEGDLTEFINEELGIAYDCPPLDRLFDLISYLAGSSLSAASALIDRNCDVAINWCGGWHHGQRDEAAGFCYVNDIVIAILHLLDHGFRRVVYVDLDLHHGDGVENAFAHTDKVLTVSFHHYETGFFPGTGNVNQVGSGQRGRFFAVNVPLKAGLKDASFVEIVTRVLEQVKVKFDPQIVVCQCGADGLVGDPMNSFNLTLKGYGECLKYLLKWNIPMLVVGGGGYNLQNTARCWTYLTGCLLGLELDNDIPDHSCHLLYRPGYELHLDESLRPDLNIPEFIEKILDRVFANLQNIKVINSEQKTKII